jgi:hypothetical protein
MTAVAAVVATVLLAVSSPAQQESPPDGFLRVQWHVVELPEPIHIRLEGYVYNTSPLRVSDVRLHVVERDSAAHAVGEAWGWVSSVTSPRAAAPTSPFRSRRRPTATTWSSCRSIPSRGNRPDGPRVRAPFTGA